MKPSQDGASHILTQPTRARGECQQAVVESAYPLEKEKVDSFQQPGAGRWRVTTLEQSKVVRNEEKAFWQRRSKLGDEPQSLGIACGIAKLGCCSFFERTS